MKCCFLRGYKSQKKANKVWFQGYPEKQTLRNWWKCKTDFSHSNGFRDMVFSLLWTSLIPSLLIYTKELYALERNNHISKTVWVRKVCLIFSQVLQLQLFRATLELKFTCLFLPFIASQKTTIYIDTPCRPNNSKIYSSSMLDNHLGIA